VLILTTMAVALAATSSPAELEIRASLEGYNLLWPSTRCCAFNLHIYPNGHETIVANIGTGPSPSEFTQNLTLTAEQLQRIRIALNDADFVNLPTDLCCGWLHSDHRHLSVRVGTITHAVNIPDDLSTDAPLASKQQLIKLKALWAVVTDQVKIPGANVK
jgi:hypothetical protein